MGIKELSVKELVGKIRYIFQNITLEPIVFIFAMSVGVWAIAADQLYIDKMCQVNLNHSAEICDNIYDHKEIQLTNQEKVTNLRVISTVIQSIPPFLCVLIAGPWCDKHGRKPLIIITMFGYAIANTVFLINTIWFHELKAEYLMFEALQGNIITFHKK